MEDVEHLIVGAGPAGLRAAQVLAEAGREVLVLEKRPEIGPKTCAGGLTLKTMERLERLGLPRDVAFRSVGHVALTGYRAVALDQELTAENDELTPTLKVKRRVIDQKYRAVIDAIYSGASGTDFSL